MDMRALLSKMVIFVALMVLGYIAARTKKVSATFAKDASWLTINVFMTGTILNSAISNVPEMGGKEMMNMMLILFVTLGLIYLIAVLAAKLLRQNREYEGLSMALMGVVNSMFIALPVVQQLCGNEAVLYVSMACLPYNLMLYTYGVWRIRSGEGKFSFNVKEIFSVPLIATLIALVLFTFRLPVPQLGREILGTLSNVTMPMSMLVVGTSLGSIRLSEAFTGWRTYAMAAVRLLVTPILVWLVIRNLTGNAVLITAATMIAASPSGIIVTALSLNYGKDEVYASKNILANTALSMFTIPLIVYLLF